MSSDVKYTGTSRNDARFTPRVLARALVEQALEAYGSLDRSSPLLIVDPACGSGVFLQESLLELESRGFVGSVNLVGYDTSEIAVEVSRRCLGRVTKDTASGMKATVRIEQRDALLAPWDKSDIVLTNPPFVGWKKMKASEKIATRDILGAQFAGHADKAMPFLVMAVDTVRPGGIVAAIIPSPLLETSAGLRWRSYLSSKTHVNLIGRFMGFGFFEGVLEYGINQVARYFP
jgi:adenine-specific DNA-methyltransferase